MKTSATIRDVAKAAGVSTATVSRVVNGQVATRPETAERVNAAIQALGFRPNAMGRSLKTARTRTFGVMIPSLSNPVFADVVAGLQEAAQAAGYSVLMTSNNYRPEAEDHAVDTMLSHQVEGLVLTVADADESALLDRLDRERVPYVLLHNHPTSRNCSAITVDNAAAGQVVAREMIRLGHRRLGMVAGAFSASDRSRARYVGFARDIEVAGLAPPVLAEVDFIQDRVTQAIAELYGASDAPTALFCSTDLLAISVIGALRRLDISVPEEVSVVGFDGIAFGQLTHPSLATVVQPTRDMGQAAIQHLLGRLAGGSQPRVHLLPTVFRSGGSLGPVASPDRAARRPHA